MKVCPPAVSPFPFILVCPFSYVRLSVLLLSLLKQYACLSLVALFCCFVHMSLPLPSRLTVCLLAC